jgi:hypothetical protein
MATPTRWLLRVLFDEGRVPRIILEVRRSEAMC